MTKRKSPAPQKSPAPKPIDPSLSKSDQLKSLLSDAAGATVTALSEHLGWQPHTTRAALTRLKQAGMHLEKLAPTEGSRQSRYRLAGGRK